MDLALWIAKSGLEAHHKRIAIISNNLANASTTGFKKNRPEFADLAYQVFAAPGAPTSEETNRSSGLLIGKGVTLENNKKIFSQGSATQTDNPLDVAIEGRGFFKIQQPNESEFLYTRTGTLNVNAQGQLIVHNGYLVQPVITIPEGVQKISIAQDGAVSVKTSDGAVNQVGQLELVDFVNPAGLESRGENFYAETLSSGQAVDGTPALNGFGVIRQGELEASNVNIVEEMIDMIEAQRTFDVNSKVISAIDSMYQKLDKET